MTCANNFFSLIFRAKWRKREKAMGRDTSAFLHHEQGELNFT